MVKKWLNGLKKWLGIALWLRDRGKLSIILREFKKEEDVKVI